MVFYRKNFQSAYSKFESLKKVLKSDSGIKLTAQIISDMGKTCIYGSSSSLQNANLFDGVSKKEKESEECTKLLVESYDSWKE